MYQYLIDIISGKRRKIYDRPILVVLFLLEIIYFLVIKARSLLYRFNILNTENLDCRVISIGNITTGGTGKTPVVDKFTRMLKAAGKKVVIISRGYGGSVKGPAIVSDGKEIKLDVDEAGDEVYMLARQLPDIPVVIGKDRYQAGQLVLKEFNPDIILLDDGFQHRQLGRDLDIVVINALEPYGNNHLLPRGFLREPLSAFKRADIFIISKSDQVSREKLKKIENKLRTNNQQAGIFTSCHRPLFLRPLTSEDKDTFPLAEIKGKKIMALSAIGSPDSFLQSLESLEAEVIKAITYPDHYSYREKDLMDIAVQAQLNEVEWVVTTEKDAVKFTDEMLAQFHKLNVGIFALRIELELTGDGDEGVILNLLKG